MEYMKLPVPPWMYTKTALQGHTHTGQPGHQSVHASTKERPSNQVNRQTIESLRQPQRP